MLVYSDRAQMFVEPIESSEDALGAIYALNLYFPLYMRPAAAP